MYKKIGIIVGTRPEIIKLAPIMYEFIQRNINFVLIHTNQHYTKNMDEVFFNNLKLPTADYNLNVGSASHAIQTAQILTTLEPILIKEEIELVFVQGDTNTVLAGSLAASKLNIKIAHVEAGLRSYDRTMPEETNRIITDHISDYLFAVTDVQRQILEKEGISKEKVHVVGNTIVDILNKSQELIGNKNVNEINKQLGTDNYFLMTAHRPENVDDESALNEMLNLCNNLSEKFNKKIVWPIHPRAKKNIKKYNLKLSDSFIILEPQDYFDFILLMKNAFVILTDSGGLQEESCILKVPCLTLRNNTERPESIKAGGNTLVGRDIDKAIQAVLHYQTKNKNWDNPFGDGDTAKKIIDIISSNKGKF